MTTLCLDTDAAKTQAAAKLPSGETMLYTVGAVVTVAGIAALASSASGGGKKSDNDNNGGTAGGDSELGITTTCSMPISPQDLSLIQIRPIESTGFNFQNGNYDLNQETEKGVMIELAGTSRRVHDYLESTGFYKFFQNLFK